MALVENLEKALEEKEVLKLKNESLVSENTNFKATYKLVEK